MSRIGKKPIPVPSGVKVTLDPKARNIRIDGSHGKLSYDYRPEVAVEWDESGKRIVCTIPESRLGEGQMRAYWGTVRSRIANMVKGVTDGFKTELEIVGVGWNAQTAGKKIKLNIGYCHPVELDPPAGVAFAIQGAVVTITGPDKQAVGQFAAVIRSKRPPEPYNGKGIKYVGEQIIRKEGKSSA